VQPSQLIDFENKSNFAAKETNEPEKLRLFFTPLPFGNFQQTKTDETHHISYEKTEPFFASISDVSIVGRNSNIQIT
jgi:hypothetical protein